MQCALNIQEPRLYITASPIAAAAAVVMATAADNKLNINLINVLSVTIPATLIGLLVACTWSLKRGKDLDKDEEFQERCKDEEFRKELIDIDVETQEGSVEDKSAKKGLTVFVLGHSHRYLCGNVWQRFKFAA